MNTKTILSACLACLFQLSACATEKQKLDENIVNYISKSGEIINIPVPAFAFCIPEFSLVLQQDSVLDKYWTSEMKYMSFIENEAKDIYLSKLLQIQFLKDSLISYNKVYNTRIIKQFVDKLNKIPEYNLQEEDMYFFLTSFTDESGVGAEKIETLLLTQDLDIVFNYIENDEEAYKRFLIWINEEIEVWCPSLGTGNEIINERIVRYIYERLDKHNSTLAHQAAKRMKEFFKL